MRKSIRWVLAAMALQAAAIGVALCASSANSQTFTTLVEFTGTGGMANGISPRGSLTVSGTTLYGMTIFGGIIGEGNIFSVGTNGSNFQNLLSFTGAGGTASGQFPYGSLALIGTNLYGMTEEGGGNGDGNIFSVGVNGTNYRNLVSFTGSTGTASGVFPYGSLTASDSTLYGMTELGGANDAGIIFSVGTGGTSYKNLVSFTGGGGTANGYQPHGSLALAGTTLYGMTELAPGGADGNIFSVGVNGTNYRNLVTFTGYGSGGTASGYVPVGSLIVSGTNLYGMTSEGGDTAYGNVFSVGTNGTNFENLVSFTGTGGTASGWLPKGDLILSGTTLYGTTQDGGIHGYGNIFSVGIDGSHYHDLYNFTGGADGGDPTGNLTLSGGTLFGMSSTDGTSLDGTVFALTLPTPEPSSLALVAAAAAVGLLSYALRRRATRTAKPAILDQHDAPAILSFPSQPSPAQAARRAA